jgi:hypothetical protein
MKSEKPHDNNLTTSRVGTLLLFFRQAGVTLNTHSISTLHSVYNITIEACYYSTFASCFMDVLNSRDNMADLMRRARLFLTLIFIEVMHIFFR